MQAALSHPSKLQKGVGYNLNEVKPRLEKEFVKRHVLGKYDLISQKTSIIT